MAQWIDRGVPFPKHSVPNLRSHGLLPVDCHEGLEIVPRVVGLVLDTARKVGFVNPLIAKASDHWNCIRLLPFSAQAIEHLFLSVCSHFIAEEGLVPERFGFTLSGELRENCTGSSMDVAGLLAVFDALSDHQHPLLNAACAVVEPAGEWNLEPVKHIDEKLAAFVREYGRGSLLVRSPRCGESESYTTYFDEVWSIESLAELAERMGKYAELLTPVTEESALGQQHTGSVLSRLRSLSGQRDHSQVTDLCERAKACGFAADVTLHSKLKLDKYHRDAFRHTGNCSESLRVGGLIDKRIADGPTIWSSEEKLEHAVAKAAVMIDRCDFREAFSVLETWLKYCSADPERFTAQRRVELWNTAARCLVCLNERGWQDLFSHSHQIQEVIDPAGRRRTEGYLIHAFLRTGQLDSAEKLLVEHESAFGDAGGLGAGFTRFYRHDLERRQGRVAEALKHPDPHCYTYAFAASAFARQSRRDAGQAVDFLTKATATLNRLIDQWSVGPDSILRLISSAIALRCAAYPSEADAWQQAVSGLRNFDAGSGIATAIGVLPAKPSVDAAEELLSLLPYL